MTKTAKATASDSHDHPPRSDLITASVPLHHLTAWKGNVRKTEPDAQVEELAASIAAHGLLQPLIVRPLKKGFEVVAGRRRFLALHLLVSTGRLEPDCAVACQVFSRETDATEISLVENAVRVAMHPADQYEAFSKLAATQTVSAIAVRFGVSESTVKKRLALGRVSPVLMLAYRRDDMDLEQLTAFTITDDHVEQERVWAAIENRYSYSAYAIRRLLTESDVPGTDKRVRFVTLDAYEAAGGAVRRDLFTEGEDGAYVSDVPLLETLVSNKLAALCEQLRSEGWKWTECRAEFGYEERCGFGRVEPEQMPLSPEQEAEIGRLNEELERIGESDDADASERAESLEERIDGLSKNERFTPEQIALAGVMVTLAHDGTPRIERGLMRPEDMPGDPADPGTAQRRRSPDTGMPASLVEALTVHKSAIIAAELLRHPETALAAVVHSLLLSTLCMSHDTHRVSSCVRISLTGCNLKEAQASTAYKAIEKARTKWMKKLPGNSSELWPWCLKQKRDTLLELMAFIAAETIDAVQRRHERSNDPRLAHANDVAGALGIEIAHWFRPTADNFFSRISKGAILAAHTEATGNPPPPSWTSMKKPDLAAAAERTIGIDTDWLPEPVRIDTTAEHDRQAFEADALDDEAIESADDEAA